MKILEMPGLAGIGTFEITVAIIGMVVVFASLVLLVWFFLALPAIVHYNYKKLFGIRPRILRFRGKTIELEKTGDVPTMTGEMNVAIATALYLYFNELHDKESNVLTMHRMEKHYSPWSSKIYNINKNNPFR